LCAWSGFLAARDEHRLGRQVRERAVRPAGHEATIQRHLARSDPEPRQFRDGVGQKRVFSAGLPITVEAGTISPRAPGLVFSVTSLSWLTYPNSFGFPSLPLRMAWRPDLTATGSDP
jgi:hypothetical protein